ncbi:hypothetical protein [Ulvibacterium sp.]|uniref:hypothetical protein n=1 Tax=Ulvibacterium sp. TaxID=2665914 RepID=UPI003CC56695
MRKLYVILVVWSYWNISNAQIDGTLLMGLTNATTSEMNTVSNPVTGSLLYNTTEQSVFQYNGSTWESISNTSGSWNMSGNSGTLATTDFIGTTDTQDFVLRSNNVEKLRLVQNKGQVLVNQAPSFNDHPLVIRANGVDVLAFQDNTGTARWHWNLLGNGLNFVESNVADYRLFLENGGQVGINTNTPSEQLDVNGTARIRTLGAATNTDDILAVNASGVLQRSKINFGGRWTNSNTSTNLNVNNTIAPIFGTQDYADDGTDLYEVSGNTLVIKESGRYDIRANLSLVGINSGNNRQRTNVNARIAVNGTPVGAIAASGYIRWASGHDHSSIHLNEILQLNTNDVVSIITYREANSGTVNFSGADESSFMINKLR